MKSFIFIAAILLGSLTMAQAQTSGTPATGKQEQGQLQKASRDRNTTLILITVDFGSPLLDCLALGICKVEWTVVKGLAAYDGPHPRGGRGTAGIVDNRFVVWFTPESITPENMKTHFPDDVFTVNEPFVLSKEVVDQLGIKQYTIKPGKYPVTRTEDGKMMVAF